MKIAQFINTIDDGGAETLIIGLTQQLLKRGIEVEIHAFDDSWIIEQCIKLKLPHVPLGDKFKKVHSIRKLPLWGYKYGKLLKSRNITVLHSHVFGGTLRGAAAACWSGIKHVATQHDNYSLGLKKSRRHWLNIAGYLGTTLVMISNQMKEYYADHGVDRKYFGFVYNGVEGKRFHRNNTAASKIRKELNVSDNEVMFVAPGRLRQVKGFDVLINAFAQIKDSAFKLFILGDGPLRDELESQVQTIDLTNNVRFLGAVNNIEDYLSAADVFTLASRSEGLSCSIIESMFAGLPVVTTNVGGNPELVRDGVNGLLVPSEDPNALAVALTTIMGDTVNRNEMSGKSLKHSQFFTLEIMTSKYVSLYTTASN